MTFDDSNSSDYLQSETVLQAEVVFARDAPSNTKDPRYPYGSEEQFYSIKTNVKEGKREVHSDRFLFITLYTMLFLAIAGLAFSVTRYVQVKSNIRSQPSSQEIGNNKLSINDNISSITVEDVDPDRDPITYRSDIEYILSSEIYKGSRISFLDGAQKKTIDWLVYEDLVLTSTKIREMVAYKNNSDIDDDLVPTFPLVQRYALMVLFFETNGELWSEKSWTEQTDLNECKFTGVECDLEDQVVVLDLAYRKLRGRLPEEVGLLTKLESASFLSNSLEGTIPSFFYNELTNLRMFPIQWLCELLYAVYHVMNWLGVFFSQSLLLFNFAQITSICQPTDSLLL